MIHLCITLLCIAVHPKCFTIMWGVSPQPPPVCSIHLDDAASTGHRRSALTTTHQPQVKRRESHRANQVDGDYYEAMIDKGQWWEIGQDTRVTPLLFTRSAMGFLMTTESQDLGLTPHPKDGTFWQYSGALRPTQITGWAPLVGLTYTSSSCNLLQN